MMVMAHDVPALTQIDVASEVAATPGDRAQGEPGVIFVLATFL